MSSKPNLSHWIIRIVDIPLHHTAPKVISDTNRPHSAAYCQCSVGFVCKTRIVFWFTGAHKSIPRALRCGKELSNVCWWLTVIICFEWQNSFYVGCDDRRGSEEIYQSPFFAYFCSKSQCRCLTASITSPYLNRIILLVTEFKHSRDKTAINLPEKNVLDVFLNCYTRYILDMFKQEVYKVA